MARIFSYRKEKKIEDAGRRPQAAGYMN